MSRTKIVLALACMLALIAISEGKVQKGSVKGKSGVQWVPIARFWFGASVTYPTLPTWLKYDVTGTTPSTRVLIYDDQPQRWQTAYSGRQKLSCEELQQIANDYTVTNVNQSDFTYKFNESYARHWYVVLSDCNNTMNLEYTLTFNNVGGKHSYQFSMDEQGLWGIFLSFFLFFMFLLIGQLIVAYLLHQSQTFFRVVQLLALSVILQFVAMMFGLIHYDQYARNGVGSPGSHFFGEMLNFVAHWIFIVMLLLIARGTNETFVLSQRKNSIIAVGAFFFLDVIFWIWRTVASNTVLSPPFIFGSAPGIIMLIIRALLGVYFILLLRFSYIEEGNPDRRAFLFRFGIVGSVWFFFLPFIVSMTAAFLASSVESYAMTRTVLGFWYTVNFVIICSFTFFFYWPSRISNFYDFSKADVMIGASSSTSPYETL